MKKYVVANDIDYYQFQYWVRKYNHLVENQSSLFIHYGYQVINEEVAYQNVTNFNDKWDSLYPIYVKSRIENQDVISPCFKSSANI